MTHYSPKVLRRPAVEATTGLSRSTIYHYMQAGTFPKPIRLGAKLGAVGFRFLVLRTNSLLLDFSVFFAMEGRTRCSAGTAYTKRA